MNALLADGPSALQSALCYFFEPVRQVLIAPLTWSIFLAAALWLVLPRGKRRGQQAGTILLAVSLILLSQYLPTFGGFGQELLFWFFAALTCISAVATVSMRSPVYSALCFALALLGTAGLFLLHGAQFLGVATIVVYAGAIVVTFLFVLMLAQPEGHAFYDRISWGPLPLASASLLAALIVGGLAYSLHTLDGTRRFVASVLPEIQDAEGGPLLSPNDLLAARLERAERDGYFVLYLELQPPADGAPLPSDQLAAQLAEKAFSLAPHRLQIVHEYINLENDPLASPQHVAGLGGELFSKHLISVEVAGTLLLAALVGAVAMIMQGRSRPAEEPLHA